MAENNGLIEEIINRVDERLNARGRTFHCAWNDNDINVDEHHEHHRNFQAWKKTIIEFFGRFILNNLDTNWNFKMIVIGSSAADDYNNVMGSAAYAMVARGQDIPIRIVLTINNLIKALHSTFRANQNFVEPTLENYDYQCDQLNDNVLFINVCLDRGFENHKYAVCSILFINELLKVAKERNQRLAVMDFRLVCHKHGDNISGNFPGEERQRNIPGHNQTDELYTIRNPDGYHHYPLLCHPVSLDDPTTEFNEIFREMSVEFPIIRKMYRPPNSEDW